MKKEYLALPIPYGFKAEGCTVVKAKHDRGATFIKDAAGTIYIVNNTRNPVNMLHSWTTTSTYRAYCQIAGIKVSEILAARKARKVEEKKEDDAAKLQQLRSRAKQFGFKLVRMKEK